MSNDAIKTGQAEVLVILGKRGSGKTTHARKLVVNKPRLIIYDSNGHDYNTGVIIETYSDLVDYLEQQGERPFKITYKPLHNVKAFPPFCSLIRQTMNNVTILIDEVDLYATPAYIDDDFLYLLKIGRHQDIEIFAISRRPAEMNRNISAQSTQFFIFNTTEPCDIKYFKSLIGEDAEKIKKLDKFKFLHYNYGKVSFSDKREKSPPDKGKEQE